MLICRMKLTEKMRKEISLGMKKLEKMKLFQQQEKIRQLSKQLSWDKKEMLQLAKQLQEAQAKELQLFQQLN